MLTRWSGRAATSAAAAALVITIAAVPAAAERPVTCDGSGHCRVKAENGSTAATGEQAATPKPKGDRVAAKDDEPEVPAYYRSTGPNGEDLCVDTGADWDVQVTIIDEAEQSELPAACRDTATATPRLTPAALAQMAVARLVLPEPDIGSVPEVGPDRVGLVGMPVWLWTDPADWRPIRATAAVPGMSITATARIIQVVWDMGDGSKVTCRKPGTVYRDRFANRMSPDCGYRYQQPSSEQPNDAYTVTATATYQITWTGAASGSMTRTRSSSVPLTIGELQVLVTSH
jgi:hypothetical protein